jgi:hypothetical protein
VPTQLANADKHAERRGWRVAARFKDDGYSASKEIKRDDFVNCPPYPIHHPGPEAIRWSILRPALGSLP